MIDRHFTAPQTHDPDAASSAITGSRARGRSHDPRMDATAAEPTQELHGRDSLAPVFDHLNTYETTTHFNGQSTVSLDGDRATAESYCLAHHLSVDGDGQRTLMIASIRYLDELVKQDGGWL
ncbi:nuclear transport factor 2 family protein [Streptomyces sp. NPDC056309]|uniref:nuclear transport factor 2 family protein n=1 Tax=unclassified Streptomyces TaxID=2593676 RepID=UPI0035D69723